jgi:FG-GAP repeat protein
MSKPGQFLRAFLRLGIVMMLLLSAATISNLADDRIQLAVDTSNFTQDGLFVLFGGLRLQGDKGLPVAAGDINGDGRADVIFCGMYGSAGAGNRRNNGQVNFYLSDGRDTGFLDQRQNPSNILTLVGERSGDLLGTSVSANGDVNGDGLRDVVVAASLHDGPSGDRFNAGAAYVVLGSQNLTLNTDLSTIDGNPPPGIIAIYGPQTNGRMGIWTDAGDVDSDGIGDIIIGSDQINSDAGPHVGGAYIVFGSTALPQKIDLAAPPAGVRVTRIAGSGVEDHWGAALHIGDINNDGIGDLTIGGSIFRDSGSYVSPQDEESGHNDFGASFGGTRNRAGEVFVLYGSRNWPAHIDLRTPPAGSTHVVGANSRDLLGSQLHSGDLNGDGRTELIMGALQALAPDNRGRTGAVYVVYGSTGVAGATIDLRNPDASGLRVVTVYGENNLDCGGDSVRSFDINKDGRFELFVGSPEHTLEPEDINGQAERDDAGDTKFIFGQADFLPSVIKLYDPPAGLAIFRLAGADGEDQGLDGGDEFSYRLTGGDVDGDGYVDYISNAMHGDGLGNSMVNAGEVYIFSGKKLSARLGRLEPEPVPGPQLQSATLSEGGQVVVEANAGQTGLRVTVNGTNFRTDTEIQINGTVVISRIPSAGGLAATQRIVELDENPAIRNSAGALRVRARNTLPASALSNEVTAGTLVGPEITGITFKRKATGVLILKISGSRFQQGMTAVVTGASGQQIPVKSVTFNSSQSLTAKIAAQAAPPRSSTIRVRVATSGGVGSNELAVSVAK